MLIRILAENPGPTFTRNMDTKFVNVVRTLLREGKDPSVQQILRETLDTLEVQRSHDPGLGQLLTMWRSIKGQGARLAPGPYRVAPPFDPRAPPVLSSQQQPSQAISTRRQLPSAAELASRVEESRNTSKILLQLLQSTPTEEIMGNDLIKEFAERCQSASQSMQQYINCDSPPPDDDTMQTLIETNEQLSLSMSRYQRALLSARRAMGAASPGISPNAEFQQVYNPPSADTEVFAPPPHAPRSAHNSITNGLSPVSPESENASYSAPPHPPPAIADRMQNRSFMNQTPIPHSPPPAPIMSHAEPLSQDPFGDDHAEKSNYEGISNNYGAHPFEPAHYGPPIPSSSRKEVSSPPRPGPGAYHNGVTPSYIGRQASAADGLTMHGAGLQELDAESRDGRSDRRGDLDPRRQQQQQPVVYRY